MSRLKPNGNSLNIILIILSLLFSSACATGGKVIVRQSNDVLIPNDKSLVLAPVLVKHISIENDSELDLKEKNEVFAKDMQEEINRVLKEKGFVVQDLKSFQSEQSTIEISKTDGTFFKKYFYPDLDEDAINFLNQLNNNRLLVVSMVIKVGPNGYWNPMSGAIASGMSNTRFRAVLIENGKRTKPWQNEVFVREVPQPGSITFSDTVAALFINLTTTNGGNK